MMAEWPEIEAHLRAAWQVVAGEPGWSGLAVDCDGVKQHVVVKAVPGARLIVAASVCAVEHVAPEHALRYNGAAEQGMLMLEGRTYVLRQLVSATLDGLDGIVRAMANEAARLRQAVSVVRTDVAGALFAFFAD